MILLTPQVHLTDFSDSLFQTNLHFRHVTLLHLRGGTSIEDRNDKQPWSACKTKRNVPLSRSVYFFSCMSGKEKFTLYFYSEFSKLSQPARILYETENQRKKKKHFNLSSLFLTFRLYRELNTEDLTYIFPRENELDTRLK